MPRPALYNPEQIAEKFDQWMEELNAATEEVATARGDIVNLNKPRIPTLQFFYAVILGIDQNTWASYQKRPEYKETVTRVRETILAYKWSGLINGDGSTRGIEFDLRVNHGANPVDHVKQETQISEIKITQVNNDRQD